MGACGTCTKDHRRSQRATRAIEERHDLERVPSRSNGRPAPTQAPELVHPAERALKERGVPSWRAQIKAVVDDVMSVAVTPKQFEEALAKRGVGSTATNKAMRFTPSTPKMGKGKSPATSWGPIIRKAG